MKIIFNVLTILIFLTFISCANKNGKEQKCPKCDNKTQLLVGDKCVNISEIEECGPDGHSHGVSEPCHCFSDQTETKINGQRYCLQTACVDLSVCSGNGKLENEKCTCNHGYVVDENDSSKCIKECSGNGKLENEKCTCNFGYKLDENNNQKCIADFCSGKNCLNGSFCFVENDEAKCDCSDSGFTGERCENNINDCEENSCKNNGLCIDGIKSFTCDCSKSGFTGERCEKDINECEINTHNCSASDNKVCENTLGSFECKCKDGYEMTEKKCVYICDESKNFVVNKENNACVCENGYHLDKDICIKDEKCESNTCGTGTCSIESGLIKCDCADSGFEGERCEKNINDCLEKDCSGHGNCIDEIKHYTCNCYENYEGDNCEIYNPCQTVTCSNHGQCSIEENKAKCVCDEGYILGENNTCLEQVKEEKEELGIRKIEIIMNEGHLHGSLFHANPTKAESPFLRRQEMTLTREGNSWKHIVTDSKFSVKENKPFAIVGRRYHSLEFIFYDENGQVINQTFTDNAKRIQIFFNVDSYKVNSTQESKIPQNISEIFEEDWGDILYFYRDTNPSHLMYTGNSSSVNLLRNMPGMKDYANIGMKSYFSIAENKISYDLKITIVKWINKEKDPNLKFNELPEINASMNITTFSIPVFIISSHPGMDATEYKNDMSNYFNMSPQEFQRIDMYGDGDPESSDYYM